MVFSTSVEPRPIGATLPVDGMAFSELLLHVPAGEGWLILKRCVRCRAGSVGQRWPLGQRVLWKERCAAGAIQATFPGTQGT